MIKQFIKTRNTLFFTQLNKSIKHLDVEETYDLFVNRPIGLLIAFVCIRLHIKPSIISLGSLITGLYGGIFFYQQDNLAAILTGSLIILFAGILDSSDGQVARLTSSGSKWGQIIDGLCDRGAFTMIYIAGAAYFYPQYGVSIFLLSAISGLMHSLQATAYDYHKASYLHFGCGFSHEKFSQVPDKIRYRFLAWCAKFYDNQQSLLTSRTKNILAAFNLQLDTNKASFTFAYRKRYERFLTAFALVGGTISHTYLIIFFSIIGRFDIYLWLNIGLTLPLIILIRVEKLFDNSLLTKFN